MKFFYKIFLSMLLVLTVSLATIEYLTVSYSLEHALQREENTALSSDGQIFDPDSATWHYGRLHNVQYGKYRKIGRNASWCSKWFVFCQSEQPVRER